AVIGPDAYPAVTGGGGSSEAQAFEPVSILTGIANLAGPNVSVLYARGLPEMNDVFRNTRWEGDVKVTTHLGRDFSSSGLAKYAVETVEHNLTTGVILVFIIIFLFLCKVSRAIIVTIAVAFLLMFVFICFNSGISKTTTTPNIADWKREVRGSEDTAPHSIRYMAKYTPAKSGRYVILGAASGKDAFKVFVDGNQVLAANHAEGQIPQSTTLDLLAGKTVTVTADYLPYSPGVRFGLGIAFEADLVSDETRQFAAKADVVVVAVGFSPATEGEGHDRTFSLPWGQDALIEAVATANPRTIVTLTAGGGVDTRRWLDKVPALLHTWYPGQEGGTAVAEVLFGKRNPEGKLPVSFDRSWEENPSAPYYYPIKGADTKLHVTENDKWPVDYVIPHVKYEDGLMVGYRYWTTIGKHPLFPFGFGLSYTTFSFTNLQVPATTAVGSAVTVSFDVTNTGSVAGAEVAQLYVSDPSSTVKRPERELKGFEKVRLAPGETKHVTLNLDARSFSYWDSTAHKWTIDPGKFIIRVGDSSENTPLSAKLTLN
ncbi:MAG TPA: efflux RND transporter permease subunit, partial [Terracidiphilus sp.]